MLAKFEAGTTHRNPGGLENSLKGSALEGGLDGAVVAGSAQPQGPLGLEKRTVCLAATL